MTYFNYNEVIYSKWTKKAFRHQSRIFPLPTVNRYSVTLTELRYLREITEISYFENANFILLSFNAFCSKAQCSPGECNKCFRILGNLERNDNFSKEWRVIFSNKKSVWEIYILWVALRIKFPKSEFSLVRIFLHLDWITEIYSVYLRIQSECGKYGPEKLQIWTIFTKCKSLKSNYFRNGNYSKISAKNRKTFQ